MRKWCKRINSEKFSFWPQNISDKGRFYKTWNRLFFLIVFFGLRLNRSAHNNTREKQNRHIQNIQTKLHRNTWNQNAGNGFCLPKKLTFSPLNVFLLKENNNNNNDTDNIKMDLILKWPKRKKGHTHKNLRRKQIILPDRLRKMNGTTCKNFDWNTKYIYDAKFSMKRKERQQQTNCLLFYYEKLFKRSFFPHTERKSQGRKNHNRNRRVKWWIKVLCGARYFWFKVKKIYQTNSISTDAFNPTAIPLRKQKISERNDKVDIECVCMSCRFENG